MATDMTKILDNVEQDLQQTPLPPFSPAPTPSRSSIVETFAPQRHRNSTITNTTSDNLAQIQLDFHKHIADMETRLKAMLDELKRAAG